MLPYCVRSTANPRAFQRLCREASTHARRLRKAEVVDSPKTSKKARATTAVLRKEQPILEQRVERNNDGTEGISWFEQDVVTGERRKVDDTMDEMRQSELRQKELRRQLRGINADLRKYDTGDEGELDEAMLELLSPEDRAKVLATQEEERLERAAVLDGLLVEVPSDIDTKYEPHLRRLNRYLRIAALNPHVQNLRSQLLVAHKRARSAVPGYLDMLSDKAWDTLWELLPGNIRRNSRQLVLSFTDDMVHAGKALSVQHRCARIEVLWVHGERARAYNELKQLDTYTQADSAKPYEVIITMCAEIGELDRALATFRSLFSRFPQSDPRIAFPIMFSLLKAKRGKEAFALYLLTRSQLGADMNMEDYDKITLIFLAHGYKNLALAAFRDMALHSIPLNERDMTMSQSKHKYANEYQSVLHRVASFQNFGKTAEEVNSINLASMTAIPKVWQNKFFYAQWLKKLIGLDQLDAAVQVVELMYERGCKPDARHINGIIGALFRRNDPESVKRGEQLGWVMIQERLTVRYQKRDEIRRRKEVSKLEAQPVSLEHRVLHDYASLDDILAALSSNDKDVTATNDSKEETLNYFSSGSTSDEVADVKTEDKEFITLSDDALSFEEASKAKEEVGNMQEAEFVAPLWETRQVPQATLETFNVLLLHYLVRQRYHMMYALHKVLNPAEIQPDIYFVNQLIYAGLYDPKHGTGSLWKRYTYLLGSGTNKRRVQQDMGTFEALWDAEIRHLHRTRHDEVEKRKFPSPRELFRHMASWAQESKRHRRTDGTKADHERLVPNGHYFNISADVCIQMLRCFSFDKDVAGLLVAIHGLKILFNVLPGDQGEDAVCEGIASMPISTQGVIRGRRRYLQSSANVVALANIKTLLQTLKQKREKEAEKIWPNTSDSQESKSIDGDTSLRALSDLLRSVLRRMSSSATEVEQAIEEAVNDMGLTGIDTG